MGVMRSPRPSKPKKGDEDEFGIADILLWPLTALVIVVVLLVCVAKALLGLSSDGEDEVFEEWYE